MTTNLPYFVMRPVRDLVLGPYAIRDSEDPATPARKMAAAAVRVTLAAFSVFAVAVFHIPSSTALAIGLAVSLPTTLLVGGAYLINEGIRCAIAAVAAHAFGELAFHLSAVFAGWLLLEVHDFAPVGLMDVFPLASWLNRVEKPIIEAFQDPAISVHASDLAMVR